MLEEVITIGQVMVFTVPFVILALIAARLTIRLFRDCSDAVPETRILKPRKGSFHERYSVNK